MVIITFIIIVATLIIIDEFLIRNRRALYVSKKIPGPRILPLVGSLYKFMWNKTPTENCATALKLSTQYKDLIRILIPGKGLLIIVHSPKYVEPVLKINAKTNLMSLVKSYFGESIITISDDKTWRHHRRILSPFFAQKFVNKYAMIISKHSQKLVERLKGGNDDEIVKRCLNQWAAATAGEIFLDYDIEAESPDIDFGKWMEKATDNVLIKNFTMYQIGFIYRFTKMYQQEKKLAQQLDEVAVKAIKNKQNNLKSTKEEDRCLLDSLVESHIRGELSYQDVIDESKTILLVSSDTSSLAACYTLLLLAMSPSIQQKLFEEVIEVLGEDRLVEVADLAQLKYTECVIKEALRIFPPVPLLGNREAKEDIVLGDGIIFPKNTSLSINLLTMQRSAEYFEDPLEFKPERFYPENSQKRPSYAYLPFGGGLRNCIGMKFAMNILKIVIAMVVRKYKLTTSYQKIEDVKILFCTSSKPELGFKIKLEER